MKKKTETLNNLTIRDKANCCIAYLTFPMIVATDRQTMIRRIGKMYGINKSEVIYNEIRSLAPDQFPLEQIRMF